MGSWADTHRRGQGGFTLLEAVLSVIIVSVAILSVAVGLLTAVRVDNAANSQQRANLALTTFIENLPFTAPVCAAVSSPPPQTGTGVINAASHATNLLNLTTANPEVQGWVDRGAVFRITNVEYARWQVSSTDSEDFSAACNAAAPTNPDPSRPVPYYPVIRVTVEACMGSGAAPDDCGERSPTVTTQVVRRGGRTG